MEVTATAQDRPANRQNRLHQDLVTETIRREGDHHQRGDTRGNTATHHREKWTRGQSLALAAGNNVEMN